MRPATVRPNKAVVLPAPVQYSTVTVEYRDNRANSIFADVVELSATGPFLVVGFVGGGATLISLDLVAAVHRVPSRVERVASG